jgi:hypothetical protein
MIVLILQMRKRRLEKVKDLLGAIGMRSGKVSIGTKFAWLQTFHQVVCS